MNLPDNDIEIQCLVYLQVIIDMEKRLITHGQPVYGPERDLVKSRLDDFKKTYYKLVDALKPGLMQENMKAREEISKQ